MLTTEAVEKQRLEATTQLTTQSTAQEKMLKEQLSAQLAMLDAETARQIELTKTTCAADAPGLVLQPWDRIEHRWVAEKNTESVTVYMAFMLDARSFR